MKILTILKKTASFITIAFVLMLLIAALPIQNNIKALTVMSGSMEPTIKTGSLIIILPQAEYKVGDIVTFGERTIGTLPKTHRIISIVDDSYRTKGDANYTEDFLKIKNKDIKGKVTLTFPYIGYLVAFLQTKNGVIAIFTLLGILIFLDIFKKYTKKHE